MRPLSAQLLSDSSFFSETTISVVLGLHEMGCIHPGSPLQSPVSLEAAINALLSALLSCV